MWEFITANAKPLGLIVTGFTLVVWTVYGQLMAASAKRMRKPRVFLKQASGRGLDAVVLLSNMGQESIFVRAVFLRFHTAHGSYEGAIEAANVQVAENADGQEVRTCQGPLPASDQMSLGTFKRLIAEAATNAGQDVDSDRVLSDPGIHEFEITAIISHDADEKIIGARRDFVVAGHSEIRPSMGGTQLLQGRHAQPLRHQLERLTRGKGLSDSAAQ